EDPIALIYALESRHAALMAGGDLDERLRLASELDDVAERAGEPEQRLLGLHWRTWDLLERGDVDLARVESARIAQLAEEYRQPIFRYHAASWEVIWAMLADRNDIAPALIARSHELG